MPYNGSGTFSVYTPGNPVVSGTTIDVSWANNTMTDFATGLTNCITKDGQQVTTAAIPFAVGITMTHATSNTIFTGTSDGSDTSSILLSGGGASAASRGAGISIFGNEHATQPGDLRLSSGNGGTSDAIEFLISGARQMSLTRLANFQQNATGVALATTATDGFFYVASCSGTPTGVPTTVTGAAAIVVDHANNKLYFRSGGAWRDAGP